MSEKILKWLFEGHTGISSETMAATVLGQKHRYGSAPCDPADLKRCIKLVDAAPEVRDAFPKIAALNKTWASVIEHWDELRDMFIAEVGYDWSSGNSAPKTYARMKQLGC